MFLWNPKTPPMLKPPRLQDISKNHPTQGVAQNNS